MDKHFKKDESVATYEAYLNFEKCKRETSESIRAFCMRLDKQSNIAKKKKVIYPDLVLAFKLSNFQAGGGTTNFSVVRGPGGRTGGLRLVKTQILHCPRWWPRPLGWWG